LLCECYVWVGTENACPDLSGYWKCMPWCEWVLKIHVLQMQYLLCEWVLKIPWCEWVLKIHVLQMQYLHLLCECYVWVGTTSASLMWVGTENTCPEDAILAMWVLCVSGYWKYVLQMQYLLCECYVWVGTENACPDLSGYWKCMSCRCNTCYVSAMCEWVLKIPWCKWVLKIHVLQMQYLLCECYVWVGTKNSLV